MPRSLQPIITTPELDRLIGFYGAVFGAKETTRVPEEGPAFYIGCSACPTTCRGVNGWRTSWTPTATP